MAHFQATLELLNLSQRLILVESSKAAVNTVAAQAATRERVQGVAYDEDSVQDLRHYCSSLE